MKNRLTICQLCAKTNHEQTGTLEKFCPPTLLIWYILPDP